MVLIYYLHDIVLFFVVQKGKCAEYVLGVRVMCMCLSGDVLYVGLSSGSVLLIDLQVTYMYMYMYMYIIYVTCACTCAVYHMVTCIIF